MFCSPGVVGVDAGTPQDLFQEGGGSTTVSPAATTAKVLKASVNQAEAEAAFCQAEFGLQQMQSPLTLTPQLLPESVQ